jgi:hypothetical protein
LVELPLDIEYIVKAYTIDGKTSVEIAKELGCDYKSILRRLKKLNITINTNRLKVPINYIIEQYKNKKSTIQIAKELKCNKSVINRCLREQNIKIRTTSEAKKGKTSTFLGKHHTKEAKNKLSKKAKERVGPKNPNWKNGISFLPYCPKFNDLLKEEIRDIFGRKCYICNKSEKENKKHLSIHHIDYNKNSICNGRRWAFVPLCISCHLKTNGKRYYYFNLLINYWATNPEINFNYFSKKIIKY